MACSPATHRRRPRSAARHPAVDCSSAVGGPRRHRRSLRRKPPSRPSLPQIRRSLNCPAAAPSPPTSRRAETCGRDARAPKKRAARFPQTPCCLPTCGQDARGPGGRLRRGCESPGALILRRGAPRGRRPQCLYRNAYPAEGGAWVRGHLARTFPQGAAPAGKRCRPRPARRNSCGPLTCGQGCPRSRAPPAAGLRFPGDRAEGADFPGARASPPARQRPATIRQRPRSIPQALARTLRNRIASLNRPANRAAAGYNGAMDRRRGLFS